MSDQLNEIYAAVGGLQKQMEIALEKLDKMAEVSTEIALHDKRISDVSEKAKEHEEFIEGTKKRQWVTAGVIIAVSTICSTVGTAFANHVFTVHIP